MKDRDHAFCSACGEPVTRQPDGRFRCHHCRLFLQDSFPPLPPPPFAGGQGRTARDVVDGGMFLVAVIAIAVAIAVAGSVTYLLTR